MEVGDRPPERWEELFSFYKRAGFSATALGEAFEVISSITKEKPTTFFAFTANLVASGIRGIIAEWVKRRWVSAVVTTAGAIEHDFIKSYKPYLLGSFFEDDEALHREGRNRIGNIIVPNDRYVLFEEKMQAVFEDLYSEKGPLVAPSEIAKAMGAFLEREHREGKAQVEHSFLYWAYKNDIPVFVPGITDGATGLQAYFFKQKRKDFGIDVTKDMGALAHIVLSAEKTAAVVLGGGISKHHVIGANIVRGGLDYALYITTAQPWDGSLSGALSSEAVSWGKISERGRHATVHGDATIVFPIIHLYRLSLED